MSDRRHILFFLAIIPALMRGADTPEVVAQTGHTNGITAITFSREGSLLVTGSADTTIKIWDVKTGIQVRTFAGHESSVTSLIFDKSGKTLISGSLDRTVR